MRRFLHLLLLAALFAGCAAEPPSVLLVTVDTLRADAVGIYGNTDARTPRIDRLAAEGTRFTSVRTPCPLTLPAHLTILTGLLPPEHGIRDNDPPRAIPPAAGRGYATLAERFADAGYATAAFVSSSVLGSRTGIAAGFSVYGEPGDAEPGALRYRERPGGETVRAAVKWLDGVDGPFFLWVHLFDPHEPYEPPVAFRSGASPTSREGYADEVAYADRCVGELLDRLADLDRTADTLVALTADHGEGLGEHGEPTHGYLLFDTTLRVPLILRRPGGIEAGAVRDESVSLAALAPTLLEEAGLPAPDGSPRSLVGEPSGAPVFAESLYGYRNMGWAQLVAVVADGRKLVSGSRDRIFDLADDPGETKPLPAEGTALFAQLDAYRDLGPPEMETEGPEIDPLAGLPYAGGTGRSRLAGLLPAEENGELPAPDPRLARDLTELENQIGRRPPDEVRAGLLALRARDPGNPSIPFWIGRNAAAAGRAPEAADAFGQAFRSGLSEAKVLDLWLQQLLLANRLEDAREVIEEHLAEVVPDAATFVMAGTLFMVTGDMEEAGRHLARAERLARSDRDRELVSRFRHNLAQEKGQ